MDGGKKTSSNKALIGVLVFLCVAIVGLVVGIVVANVNANYERENAWKDGLSEEQIIAQGYVNDYNDTRAKAKELLNRNPVDADAIVRLYKDVINGFISGGNAGRASAYIVAMDEDLLAAGLKERALDELINLDYSSFSGPDQYRHYNRIITQARDLGRDDIVSKYEPLLASVKEIYDANYEASSRAAERGEEIKARSQEIVE